MPKEDMFAFYSEASAQQNGYAVYIHQCGEEIRVTDVASTREESIDARQKRWPDIEYRGRVVSFVRSAEGPGFEFVFGAMAVLGASDVGTPGVRVRAHRR